jgi:hypothetical protein
MPALLEDPQNHIPPPATALQQASLLTPRQTTLPKANNHPVTLYPVTNGPESLPADLVKYLHAEFSAEIERGATYPMEEPMELEKFAGYWFGTFAVVALLGEEGEIREGRDWERECLGTFYVKPNYPGMCLAPGILVECSFVAWW